MPPPPSEKRGILAPPPPDDVVVTTGEEQVGRAFIRMRVTGGFKETVAEMFDSGMFSKHVLTTIEHVDNGLAASTDQTQIVVQMKPNEEVIRVSREKGMGKKDVERWFAIGESDRKGLNAKGAGAKIAAVTSAQDALLEAKLPGSPVKHQVLAVGIGSDQVDWEGTLVLDTVPALKHEIPNGEVTVTLSNMKAGWPPPTTEMRDALSEVYGRRLIAQDIRWGQPHPESATRRQTLAQNAQTGEWETVTANDRVAVFLHSAASKKTIQIHPPEVKLEPDSRTSPTIVYTDKGEPILFEAGIIPKPDPQVDEHGRKSPKDRQSARIKEGDVKLFVDGRLIEKDAFPKTDQFRDSRVRKRIYVEAEIGAVKDIRRRLRMNKSEGLQPSPEKDSILAAIGHAAAPLVNLILKEEPSRPTLLSTALRESINLGARLATQAAAQLIDRGDIPPQPTLAISKEVVRGQRRPSPSDSTEEGKQPTKDAGITSLDWSKQQPRTLLPPDADTSIPRKRVAPFKIDYSALGSGDLSAVTMSGPHAQIILNSEHAANQIIEMAAAINPSPQGRLITAVTSALIYAYHLSRETAQGNAEKQNAHFQAMMGLVGQALTKLPEWEDLNRKAQAAARARSERKRKK